MREYESDDLASDSEDEKRLRSAEKRALRSIKDKKGPHPNSKYVLSATVTVSRPCATMTVSRPCATVTVSRPCATVTTPESTFRGVQGRIQDFKLGGASLKKLRRAEGGAKIGGVFRVKNHDFTPTNHIFSNFRGGAPPGSDPGVGYQQPSFRSSRKREATPYDICYNCNQMGH